MRNTFQKLKCFLIKGWKFVQSALKNEVDDFFQQILDAKDNEEKSKKSSNKSNNFFEKVL